MADIRINDLPTENSPSPTEFAAIDGVSTRKSTIQSIVDSAAPVASQTEAQVGTNNIKRMTPLTTKQSIASEVGVTIASSAQGARADSSVQSVNSKSGNSVTLVKSDLGLGNVDNTSDANKPVSTAQQSALDLKANNSVIISAGTGLSGGGDLSSNRSIALSSASIISLSKADSSVQTVNGVFPTGGNVNVSAEELRLQNTRATAISASFPGSVNFIVTSGYTSVGDGGAALYKRVAVEPSHGGKFQSSDGSWWEISVDRVNPEMFGVDPTGNTSAVTNFQMALNYFGPKGGVLYADKVYLIDSNLNIPNNVCLKMRVVETGLGQVSQQIFNNSSKLKISSSATITLKSGSSFEGGIVIRANMAGPEQNSANYAGVAFTADGNYTKISNSVIIGFSRPYISSGFNSCNFENNKFDCLNGPRVVNDADSPLFFGNRGYPYGTIEAVGRVETFDSSNWAYRPGISYDFEGCAWPRELNNWSYGYDTGLRVHDCSNPQSSSINLEGHYQATSPFVLSSSSILISGTTTGGKITAPNCVHYQNGIIQTTGSSTAVNSVVSPYVRDCSANAIAAVTGALTIDDYVLVGGSANGPGTGGNGIRVISTTPPTIIGDGFVDGFGVGVRSASSNAIFSGKSTITNCAAKFNLESPRFNVASASTISVPEYITDVYVTGTTQITNITATRHGHMIRILFGGAASMSNTGNIRLQGGTFTATVGHVVELFCEGASPSPIWREISRCLAQ